MLFAELIELLQTFCISTQILESFGQFLDWDGTEQIQQSVLENWHPSNKESAMQSSGSGWAWVSHTFCWCFSFFARRNVYASQYDRKWHFKCQIPNSSLLAYRNRVTCVLRFAELTYWFQWLLLRLLGFSLHTRVLVNRALPSQPVLLSVLALVW